MYYDEKTAVFVRTVTFHYAGRIANISYSPVTGRAQWLTLSEASWIADTGARMGTFLKRGIIEEEGGRTEYEMYPSGVVVNADSVLDICKISGELPELAVAAKKIKREEDVFREGVGVYIRSVTFHTIGIVEQVIYDRNDSVEALRLKNAYWVPDTGVRVQDFLTDGPNLFASDDRPITTELEPFPDGVVVMASAIVDATLFNKLPEAAR